MSFAVALSSTQFPLRRERLFTISQRVSYTFNSDLHEFDAIRVYGLRYGKLGEDDVQTALILGLILRRKRRKFAARGKKRMWVRPLLQMRTRQGTYNNLIQEMRLGDRECHFSFLRMSRETFDVLFCFAVFERLRSNIPQGRKLSQGFDQLLH